MIAAVNPPARSKDCPPAFELESYSAGGEARLKAHVDGCAECARYVGELQKESADFLKARPADLFLGQVARRRPAEKPSLLRWLVPAFGLVAAALVAVVVFKQQATPELTMKGADGFRVLVKHGESREAIVAANDAVVRAGDRLRFSFTPPADGYLAVLNLDGSEQVSVFFPEGGTRSAPVKRDGAPLLEGTVTLDDAPGPEWMIAVFRTEPFDIQWIADQLRGQSKRGSIGLDCPGCRIEMVRVQKGSP